MQHHGYSEIYDLLFIPLKDKPIKIMEIGIHQGESLKLWSAFFPDAEIFGIDKDDKSSYCNGRIHTYIADQGSKSELLKVIEQTGNMDIIIDDGSHQSEHQINSFETLFPYINPEGYYIIEDSMCCYFEHFSRNQPRITDMSKNLIDDIHLNGKTLRGNKRICDIQGLTYYEQHILWMLISNGLIVFKKI